VEELKFIKESLAQNSNEVSQDSAKIVELQ
jgi:hypothetical protein